MLKYLFLRLVFHKKRLGLRKTSFYLDTEKFTQQYSLVNFSFKIVERFKYKLLF